VSHEFERMKGRAKEAVGDMTGNRKLQRDGKIDQASARVKDKSVRAVDKVKKSLRPR
jgi:uncharacterized protein YjbJ (UPF0337 family)